MDHYLSPAGGVARKRRGWTGILPLPPPKGDKMVNNLGLPDNFYKLVDFALEDGCFFFFYKNGAARL